MEQRAVDHAYRCLEHTRREAAELKEMAASASGKDAIDANRAWQRELKSLDLGRNSLVFMRPTWTKAPAPRRSTSADARCSTRNAILLSSPGAPRPRRMATEQ